MKKHIQPTVIFLLSFLVIILMRPFFDRGMFFALDAVFPERFLFIPWSQGIGAFWGNFCFFLNQFMPVEMVQKTIYGGLFVLLLIIGYANAPFQKQSAKLFFAAIITFNPFVYSRFLAGQYAVLFGYGLFIQLVLTTFEKEHAKKYVWMSIWLVLLHICSVHYLFLALLFLVLYLILHLFCIYDLSVKHMWPLIFFILFFAGSSIPVLLKEGNTQTFTAFGVEDLNIFYTLSDANLGLAGNVLGLFGFWFEGEEGITLKNYVSFWPVMTMLLGGLGIGGIFGFVRKEKREQAIMGEGLVLFLILCLFLVIAPSVSILKPLVVSLYEKIKLFYILREPHKAIGVLAFCYAFFGAYTIERKKISFIPGMVIFVLLVFTFLGFRRGFVEEIQMSTYPVVWSEAREYLIGEARGKILVFPWHSYLPLRFAKGKRIYNSAGVYFGNTIIADNYEVAGLYTHNTSLQQRHIDGLLKMTWEKKNLLGDDVEEKPYWARDLKAVRARYILLLKEYDWKQYQFLDDEPNLKPVFENDGVKIYKNIYP